MLPSVADTTLSDEQIQVGSVVMGSGTPYIITGFNPWDGSDVVSNDATLGARPGVISGYNVYRSRAITFTVVIAGSPDTKAVTQSLGAALRVAMSPQNYDIPLHFMLGGNQYFVMGRPRTVRADMKRWGAGHLTFECRFLATDPRIYEYGLNTTTGSAYVSTSSGLNFNTASGAGSIGAIDFHSSGSLTGYLDLLGSSTTPDAPASAYNSGTVSTPWQLQITPNDSTAVSGLVITHVESGSKLALSSIVLAYGTTLYLDSSDHAVLTNTGGNSQFTSARNLLSSDSTWWDLQVGSNTFQMDVSTGTANATLYWYTIEV
ncbi:Siphovirus-type tail component [uncultured Caudovirales phage]|uniref:Siphovirus-type tail component n=1 Tax=uncultured Caudovirales phage TaxID=2100421 RepID=A0A6J7WU89_9CAUD|nr:Siphovirus-type tail component [uncultured Caudovirales phage]